MVNIWRNSREYNAVYYMHIWSALSTSPLTTLCSTVLLIFISFMSIYIDAGLLGRSPVSICM
jgi:hypothetical protein